MNTHRVHLWSIILLTFVVVVVVWTLNHMEKDFSKARAQIERESFSTAVGRSPQH
ncbi:MAG: hypothetical protein JWQ35_134 [Bacteriovoracaceae bacterium]|nr:hypothetical protein [Bacteriovoracaceae bacterium]